MQCVNCKARVEQDDAKFLLKVLLCPKCYEGGLKLHSKAQLGIQNALAELDTIVRTVLTSDSIPFDPGGIDRIAFEDALLFILIVMKDKRKRECAKEKTQSSSSTKPLAPSVDGNDSSNKPSPAG